MYERSGITYYLRGWRWDHTVGNARLDHTVPQRWEGGHTLSERWEVSSKSGRWEVKSHSIWEGITQYLKDVRGDHRVSERWDV